MIVHSVLLIYSEYQREKKISLLIAYCFYVAAVSFANIALLITLAAGHFSVYHYLVPRYTSEGSMIWCLGNSFLYTGFQLAGSRSLPKISFELTSQRKLTFYYRFLLVMALYGVAGGRMGIGALATLMSVVSSIGIMFFARIWGATGSVTFRNRAITITLLRLVQALLFSFLRSELLLPIIALFVGYHIGRPNFKQILSIGSIPYLIVFLLFASIFSFMGKNRSNLGVGWDRMGEIIQIVDGTAPKMDQNDEHDEEKYGLLDRIAVLAQLTNIERLVQEKGYYNGAASEPLLLALIPRFLWPEKPSIALGSWFALEIGQGIKQDNNKVNNSINMTIPGELYMDFGWIGLAIGSFLFGGFLALLWNSTNFYLSSYNITGILFGGYLFVDALQGIGADLEIYFTMLALYLLFFIFRKLL
jgi:hypothetical protein